MPQLATSVPFQTHTTNRFFSCKNIWSVSANLMLKSWNFANFRKPSANLQYIQCNIYNAKTSLDIFGGFASFFSMTIKSGIWVSMGRGHREIYFHDSAVTSLNCKETQTLKNEALQEWLGFVT